MSTGDPNLDSIKVTLSLRKFPDKLVGYRNTAITSGLIGLIIAPGILSDLFIWALPAPVVIVFGWGLWSH